MLRRGPHTLLGTLARYRTAAAKETPTSPPNKPTFRLAPVDHPGDPRVFARILAWFNTGCLDLPRDVPVPALRRDLEYWNIPFSEEDLTYRDVGHRWLHATFPTVAGAIATVLRRWITSADFQAQSARHLEATWIIGPVLVDDQLCARNMFDRVVHRTMAVTWCRQRGIEAAWTPNVRRSHWTWPTVRSCGPAMRCHLLTVHPIGWDHAMASFRSNDVDVHG